MFWDLYLTVICNCGNCLHAFLDCFRAKLKCKVRLISEISEFSYLALGQIRKLWNLGKIFLSFRNDLRFISNCDLQLWQQFTCVSWLFQSKRNKGRLISEISVFSYLALGQLRKLGNLGKIFLNFRTDLNFLSKCDLQWWQLFSCFSWLFQEKRVKIGWFPRFRSFRI